MASLARITALLSVAFGLVACSGAPQNPDAGRAEAKAACEAWNEALRTLADGTVTPADTSKRLEAVAEQAAAARALNNRWEKLALDLRLAALQIGSLDAERARNETTYVFNGPAGPIIDTVNADCEPLTGG